MKNYRITVNGVAYDVAVEELGAGEASAAPVSTQAAVPAPAKKGDAVLVLEAMKMENEICAAQDGVIASVEVAVGDMVEGGDVLATMN